MFATTQRIGPWVVTFAWPDEATQGGPHTVNVVPADDATADELAGGLSSVTLRQLDFQTAGDEWRQSRSGGPTPGLYDHLSDRLQRLVGRGIGDEYLAVLAAAYVRLVEDGERSVTARLADTTGKSTETMRQHLLRARKAGMLTAVTGKAGGRLTDHAKELIS